jgi:hypothetical protein
VRLRPNGRGAASGGGAVCCGDIWLGMEVGRVRRLKGCRSLPAEGQWSHVMDAGEKCPFPVGNAFL